MKKQTVSYLFLSLFLVFSLFAIANSAFLNIIEVILRDGFNLRLDLTFSFLSTTHQISWWHITLIPGLFFGLLPYLFLLIHLILSERNKKFKIILIILLVLISGAYLFEGILHTFLTSILVLFTHILKIPSFGQIIFRSSPFLGWPLYITLEIFTYDIIDLFMYITSLAFVILYFISSNYKKPIKIVGIIVFVLATILKLLFLLQQSLIHNVILNIFDRFIFGNTTLYQIDTLTSELAGINLRYLDIMLYLVAGIGLAVVSIIEFKGLKKLISIVYILPIIIMSCVTMIFSVYYIYDFIRYCLLYIDF